MYSANGRVCVKDMTAGLAERRPMLVEGEARSGDEDRCISEENKRTDGKCK